MRRNTDFINKARFQPGFTLVEAVLVITITGIVAVIIALFLRVPMQGHLDAARRAELTDIADTAIRRIRRDLRIALPNSVRVDSSGFYLEFLPIVNAGRYRAEPDPSPGGATDILDFTSGADNSFDILGAPMTLPAGSQIVVYNLGIPGADAYEGSNRRAFNGAAGTATTNIAYTPDASTPARPFPLESPSRRFQVITTPVSYVCDAVTSTLWRFWNYPIQASQPTTMADLTSLGASSARLATNVACAAPTASSMGSQFVYNPGVTQRNSLVAIRLRLQDSSGEAVNLYQEVQVVNVP